MERKCASSAREALLDAAAVLFGEKGPAAVSTREIAAAAGVNNGLIHRHFRTKDALLGQVLDRMARQIAGAQKGSSEGRDDRTLARFFSATRERALYWKLLARCVLDGVPLERLQSEYPTIGRVVVLVRQMQADGWHSDGTDPRKIAALMGALTLGWLVFEPWLLRAAGLDHEDPDTVRAECWRTAGALLDLDTL